MKKNISSAKFSRLENISQELREAARIAVEEVLKVQAEEQVLIVSNPESEVSLISQAVFNAVLDIGGRPVLLYQCAKSQLDFAEEAVIAAFKAKPEVFISLSAEKLGKDRQGISSPYHYNNESWDHIFHLQIYGKKSCRAFWSPHTTVESFTRTVPIDYGLLKRRCSAINKVLDAAEEVHITAPAGTDVRIGLRERRAKSDDGDFSRGGLGGNLPAGESFISPRNGASSGVIAFDGSISLHDRDLVISEPIRCVLKDGFITDIDGGGDAKALLHTVRLAEKNAREYEKEGKLPAGSGEQYAKNAWNLGELGIGLNPKARITGSMLEDEKAFKTCHFAIGHNYDGDAPALIHLDGLVTRPTITAYMPDGSHVVIEDQGELTGPFL